MKEQGSIQFIGTGSSAGVPMIGCHCPVCQSKNPKNSRLRSSAHITVGDRHVIIDASPDFRQQALRYHLPCPDALLLSHTHYDHVGGLEEMRAFNIHKHPPIRSFVSKESFRNLKKLLYYHFTPQTEEKHFSASFDFHVLEHPTGHFDVDGTRIEYFSYAQGTMPVTGFRIGSLAYVTDIKQYDPSLFSHLKGLEILVVSAAWVTPSRMQFTIAEALEFRQRTGAQKTYFIHLSHEVDFEREGLSLPPDVALAYDGLEVEFSR